MSECPGAEVQHWNLGHRAPIHVAILHGCAGNNMRWRYIIVDKAHDVAFAWRFWESVGLRRRAAITELQRPSGLSWRAIFCTCFPKHVAQWARTPSEGLSPQRR